MIWLVIAIVGAGTFIYSGISVLSDPFCQSVDFGGGRVIQITCRDDTFGAFSQTSAGWLSILGGLAILIFIFRRPILKAFSGPNYTQVQRVDDSNFNRAFGEDYVQQNLETEEMATTVDSQETKKCKFCAETINVKAIKCKHCGSSLTPNSSEKIKTYLMSEQGKIVSVVTACLLLLISGVYVNESNKAKEMRLLYASGQICVVGDGEQGFDFGCTKYPYGEINFCSSAKVLDPFWRDQDYDANFQGADSFGRIEGIPGGQNGRFCTEPAIPNLFTYKWTTDFRVGTYKILSVEYKSMEGIDSVDNGGDVGDFVVEISIKK